MAEDNGGVVLGRESDHISKQAKERLEGFNTNFLMRTIGAP
jgi:hypothetical protein